ncbi:MAG: hypothetical protein ACYCWW_13015 [Deltaproteobacteria bacterium]
MDPSISMTLAASLSVLALAACARRGAGGSPQLERALRLYDQLYAAKLDDAYGEPEMREVLELLGKVDPASSQAPEARELRAKVTQGIAEFERRAAKVSAAERAASGPPAEAVPSELPGAARSPEPDGPPLGLQKGAFLARFGDCFELRGSYQEGQRLGEAYRLRSSCAERYPALAESLVVLMGGRVSSAVPLSEVHTVAGGAAAASPPSP